MIINLISNNEFFVTLVFLGIFLFSIYKLLINKWLYIFNRFSFLKSYDAKQKIHIGEVPRLGGFFSLIYFFLFSITSNSEQTNFYFSIIFFNFLLFLISLKEDLFHNVKPSLRLFLMFFSILVFFSFYSIVFPNTGIYFIDTLLNNSKLCQIIFFSLCVVVIQNGNNLIDGTNGLMSITNIFQILCLLVLAYISKDYNFIKYLIILFFPLFITFIFNYPSGKLFMGDLGAYLYGLLISVLTIKFFGMHPEISPWYAVLLLFYPSFELLFSFLRKLFFGLSPLTPDRKHLHSKIFNCYKKKYTAHVSNNLVMPTMILFWGAPLIFILLKMCIFGIIFLITSYIIFYLYILKIYRYKK